MNQEPEPEQTTEHEQDSAQGPQVWVASLADYAAGRLHGQWIAANQPVEALTADVQVMLERSPTPGAEEYAIFDHDGFDGLRIDQHDSLETVAALARGVAEYGEPFALWADDVGADYAAEHSEQFEEVYIGHYESETAFAEEMWEESGYQAALERAVPEPLRYYVEFDAEAWARDLRLGGDVTYLPASDGGVYVYWNV